MNINTKFDVGQLVFGVDSTFYNSFTFSKYGSPDFTAKTG